jgi:hypothetical protein
MLGRRAQATTPWIEAPFFSNLDINGVVERTEAEPVEYFILVPEGHTYISRCTTSFHSAEKRSGHIYTAVQHFDSAHTSKQRKTFGLVAILL